MIGAKTFVAVLAIWIVDVKSSGLKCDNTSVGQRQSGELGQNGTDFPWFGLLRVQFRDSKTVGLSGLVLVKNKYAIVHAMDVAKIPSKVFRDDSVAMFFHGGVPWYASLVDYLTHPEYDSMTNTIALVELALGSNDTGADDIYRPIWFAYDLMESFLGLVYTCTNNINTELETNNSQPTHSHCVVATDAGKECKWENGMVMVSNSTGLWTLIGLAIRGPKCYLPARFIDVFPYLGWVKAVTEHRAGSYGFRKSGFNIGFRPDPTLPENKWENVPLHRAGYGLGYRKTLRFFPYREPITKYFEVDRVDKNALAIQLFDEKYETSTGACYARKTLVYRDKFKIMALHHVGSAVFRVKSASREKAKIWWMSYVDLQEGMPFTNDDLQKGMPFRNYTDTPRNLLKITPPRARTDRPKYFNKTPLPDHSYAQFIKEDRNYTRVPNINLLVKFTFRRAAVMHVNVYGMPQDPFVTLPPAKKGGWWWGR